MGSGSTVIDLEPNGSAAGEIKGIMSELFDFIDSSVKEGMNG
jgi:hypothetical protein